MTRTSYRERFLLEASLMLTVWLVGSATGQQLKPTTPAKPLASGKSAVATEPMQVTPDPAKKADPKVIKKADSKVTTPVPPRR